ncbi:MAG: Nif3-like dinuclear metal center hexameric protein [Puniceicoccaceae bacterium]|nr:MAG: Nif3-like dinuclear metal center hexameric protein [Puniceicoccaceae bacterium]
MARLDDVVAFCLERTQTLAWKDFPGAWNGLQVANGGEVRRIGAAVDAGLVPFRLAEQEGVDFLIVHHGLFWDNHRPLTGPAYVKIRTLLRADCALFSCHLPLDAHPEIGNNALLARELELAPKRGFLPFEGREVGLVAEGGLPRAELRRRLDMLFPGAVTAIEYGPETPAEVAILTGSGASAVAELRPAGLHTLVTGEIRQNHFNLAQEHELNLYLCGHYATETFGVQALAREAAEHFGLPWSFLATPCPL